MPYNVQPLRTQQEINDFLFCLRRNKNADRDVEYCEQFEPLMRSMEPSIALIRAAKCERESQWNNKSLAFSFFISKGWYFHFTTLEARKKTYIFKAKNHGQGT